MARRRGAARAAPVGRRAAWSLETTTFVAGLRQDGIVAPFVIDGPIAFETYVARVLVPELRPGDVVIMDNLSSHKGPQVRAMIKAAGAGLLYLPPCSPDFNSIENAFAKLKGARRPSGPAKGSGQPSDASSTPSNYQSAPTTSPPLERCRLHDSALGPPVPLTAGFRRLQPGRP